MWPEIVFIHCQRLIDSDHSLQKLQNSIVGKFLFPDWTAKILCMKKN